jgi:hypothetical protein
MDREQTEPRGPSAGVPPAGAPAAGYDRVVSDAPAYAAAARARGRTADVMVGENVVVARDRVQWGPIVAGSLTALAVLILLAVFGVAIGASAFEPGTDISDWGSGAGIYGGISALVALFLGGWVAARSAAVEGPFAGLMNGLLAGITSIVAVVTAVAFGIDNIFGFLGSNLGDITNFAAVLSPNADPAAQQSAFDTIDDAAWGTLIVLILALAAAALGGYLAHYTRQELMRGESAAAR